MFPRTVDVGLIQPVHDAVAQAVAQTRQAARFLRQFLLGDGAGLAQADDSRNVQRARAHAALVTAAIDHGGKLHAGILAADIQGADALGPIKLVPGDRHDIDILLVHVDGNFADGLNGVRMENDSALAANLADFGDRLQYADFVVRRHDRDQDCLVIHGALQVVEIDQAVFLDRHVGHAIAILLQALTGVEDGLVLGDLLDDVVALLVVHLSYALNGEVVALGGAAREDDFFRGGAHEFGDALACGFHTLFGSLAKGMVAAGGVAELLDEVGQHLFQYPGIHLGGGVVIHIDWQLHALRARVARPR